jgi:Rps23 Pro-64 3,4-dihydroxylase Tpa1-like proline 4-hydroxylase
MTDPLAASLNEVPLALDAALDRAAAIEQFRKTGRVHIPSVLTQAAADRLYRCLTQETKWSTTFNNGPDFLDVENQTVEERSKLTLAAWQRAFRNFQYIFDNHRLSRLGEAYPDPAHYYARVVEFMNSPSFLAFVREVTGASDIAWADAQATLYRPGDMLTLHDDATGGYRRRIAYVLNMTPAWRPEWGGILNFIGPSGHIEEGYVPTFNALNMFRVPVQHFVSLVAPYAGLRYSVTGWFHAR